MSERERSLTPTALLPGFTAPVAGLAAMLLVIWAVTGAGYFWPMWPFWAFAVLVAVTTLHRWRRGERRGNRLTEIGAAGLLVVCAYSALWAMSGGGYFWPIWPILGFVLVVALPWALTGRRVLEERVQELARTRSGALDVQASELRRIERDLHDGAQARLVALSMKLGRAEARFDEQQGGEEIAALLRDARGDATAAIRELRELARGIAPPVLVDRGLEAAVRSLAERSGVDATVTATLARRPIPAVESAAYFVVAEALTNAAKHAPGARAEVRLEERGGDLFVEVTDFGPGGANADAGGLTGLAQRVEALDGQLSVTSPVGVGTQIEAVLPCGW